LFFTGAQNERDNDTIEKYNGENTISIYY
jgi:hypothetical protein